jgi:hypothetical protein
MMTPSRIDALLASLSPQEIVALKYDWTIWANAKQLPPKGDWTTWLLLGGRGAGHEKLATIYIAHRHKFLKSLSAYKTFGRGWTNRLKHLKRVVREQFKFTKKMKDYKKMPMLDGYKTYIVALFMLLAGLLEIAGINLPAIATENAGQLIMEALAILFLRKGIKQMPAKA